MELSLTPPGRHSELWSAMELSLTPRGRGHLELEMVTELPGTPPGSYSKLCSSMYTEYANLAHVNWKEEHPSFGGMFIFLLL